ncbi:MAG: hypothetical protein A6F72_00085 [Cycloclasticus sp. symbiont of Poecilosclerida sp. N]|nr:MAG: hypothetical protein A6F72_00085 [Cycloclasticus sp. symbiont of Poecilosclerida sp. N]
MNTYFNIKKQNTRSFLTVLFLLFSTMSHAHFLWLNPIPDSNKTVRLYFGEYHENLFESKDTRLAEREASTLKAYFPSSENGTSIRLRMRDNFYEGKVKTDKYGLVNLVAQDIDSPVVDWSKHGIGVIRPMYYARTQWLLFDDKKVSKRISPTTPETKLDILPITQHIDPRTGNFGPKVGEQVVFQVYFDKNPLAEKPKSVNIFAPNGWIWESKLNKQGVSRFTPLWEGTYVIEVIHNEQIAGQFQDKDYEFIRHRATFSLNTK